MPLSPKVKSIINFNIRLLFSLGILLFVFSKIDMDKTIEILKSSDLKYIFYALLVFLSTTFIILVRWVIFIRALDLKASFFQAARYFFIGLFGNLFLPSAIGGDLIKIYGLCKNSSEKPKVVASVLIDRLSGFAAIVSIAIIAFIFGHKLIDDFSIMVSVIIMGVASVSGLVVLFNEKIYSFFCLIFTKLPKFKDALMQMHYDLSLLKGKRKEALKGFGLACFSQVVLAVDFYLVAKALHQDIGLIYFLIFVPMICVAATVPSIGGLGVREAGAAYLFSRIRVESGVAVSISLINFLFMIIVGLIGGIFYVITLSSGRVQHNSSDAEVSPQET